MAIAATNDVNASQTAPSIAEGWLIQNRAPGSTASGTARHSARSWRTTLIPSASP